MARLTREDVIRICDEEGLPPEFALNVWEQESGGGKNISTSVDGAKGGFQVMPTTFQMVMPEGSIDDEEDNARAGIRVLKRGYDKYAGNPTNIYAAYHSGTAGFYTRRGNLKKDGLGKTTLSYVTDALRRQDGIVAGLSKRTKTAALTGHTERSRQRSSRLLPAPVPKNSRALNAPKYATDIYSSSESAEKESPYGDGVLSELDKQLLKLIDEV